MFIRLRHTRFPIRHGELVIGRSPYCSIVIGDSMVSRQHAAVRLVEGVLELVDLGSANGTFVNSERVTGTRRLVPGDIVQIGTEFLEIAAGDGSTAAQRRKTGEWVAPPAVEEQSTASKRNRLDVVEALVDGMVQLEKAERILAVLGGAVEALVRTAREGGGTLSDEDALRLAACVTRVLTRFPDEAESPWVAEARGLLDAHGLRLAPPEDGETRR